MIAFPRLVLLLAMAACIAAEDDLPIQFGSKYGKEYLPDETSIVATRVATPPKLDGTLDDPVWNRQAARTRSAFTNFPSIEPCGRHTVVYCCYDDQALYLAFDCEETELEQQDIDGKNLLGSDHIGVHLEVGDTRGRGRRCTIMGNRSGFSFAGAASNVPVGYACKAGPNRWFAELAIPFAAFGADSPLTGDRWGVKFTRYGRNSGTGAQRMRSCWPHIPTISEDVLAYNGTLCFGADDLLANGGLRPADGAIAGWQTAAGAITADAGGLSAPAGATLRQTVKLRGGLRYVLAWESDGRLGGTVTASAGGTALANAPLAAPSGRVGWVAPAGGLSEVAIELQLRGAGPAPKLSLSSILDDVPSDWICLTNNDWVPERNLKSRVPAAPEGQYTYLKTPMHEFGKAFYRSLGCPPPTAGDLGWDWSIVGRPTRAPVDAPPARPDIGAEEFENTPYEVIYQDTAVPEFVGLASGSFDVGGVQGSIPFSKGSLTGDPSWAGWPVDRWARGVAHDILFDFKDRYFIRRIDIQQINTGFCNLDLSVRPNGNPDTGYATIFRFNGPGTQFGYGIIPPYFSHGGLDSVAQQLRLSLGITGNEGEQVAVAAPALGRANSSVGLFGLCEIWVWGEPVGQHADSDVNEFKPYVAEQSKPLAFDQLRKLPEPVIWPRPKQLERGEGRFAIAADTAIAAYGGGSVPALAERLRATLAERYLVGPPAVDGATIAPEARAIRLGVVGTGEPFDAACRQLGIALPVGRPQAYVLAVTPEAVVVAGADLEGLRNGVQSLRQWLDHDEQHAFLRAIRVVDWPAVRMRTLVPSSDHRKPLLPAGSNEINYFAIVDALADLRFNTLLDWMPTEPGIPDERARELIHYASDRSIEIRPAMWVRDVPGDCLEINPDQQPDGPAGIGNSDGTYESDNLCPSNPKTYRAIEQFLDRALATHDDCRFIDIGFMGCLGKAWNVCRACRDRGLDDYQLYAGFINRIDRICRSRGRAPIFTNAIIFSEAMHQADQDPARFFAQVNAGITMRMDRSTAAREIVANHLWGISKPWDTPGALSGGPGTYQWGGKGFFDVVEDRPDLEAVVGAGEACDYEWRWRWEVSTGVLFVADQFWSGNAGPKTEPVAYAQLAANASVRLNERVSTGLEYPSWRTGMTPKFFTVDLRAACNRSHIDDGSASGPGRSGTKEGVNGFGGAFDFRRVPLGTTSFADIPFEIIDPATNGWRSMVVVGTAQKVALIPGAVARATIPIKRKAASLCVLRTVLRTTLRTGALQHYFNLLQPAYIFEYADGTRCVCDWEQRRHHADILNQQFFYGARLGDSVASFCMPACRLGYATNTLSGAGANLYINEFVNPYPDREIASLSIQLPNPEERDWTFEWHDAIFAVTGVEPTAWDSAWWARHPGRPLLPANAATVGSPAIPDLKWVESADGPRKIWRAAMDPPLPLAAVGFRLRMPSGNAAPMAVRYRHVDATILATEDGTTWKPLATVKGCTGMDGDHVVAPPPTTAKGLMLVLDPTGYPDEDVRTDFGVYAIDAYRRP